jgi:hypothetical protein
MIEQEGDGLQGDPERQIRVWFGNSRSWRRQSASGAVSKT